MTYHCRDCSYRGSTSGPSGQCPGCGSYSLVRSKTREAEAPPARWRLALLIGLWASLIILIIRKLNT